MEGLRNHLYYRNQQQPPHPHQQQPPPPPHLYHQQQHPPAPPHLHQQHQLFNYQEQVPQQQQLPPLNQEQLQERASSLVAYHQQLLQQLQQQDLLPHQEHSLRQHLRHVEQHYGLVFQQQQQQQQQLLNNVPTETGSGVLGGGGDGVIQLPIQDIGGGNVVGGDEGPNLTTQDNEGALVARNPEPQWTDEETRVFLSIRTELHPSFVDTAKNSHAKLWEAFSNKMKEQGYNRSSEVCVRKWKRLTDRYRAVLSKATDEADALNKFNFYNELKTLTEARKKKGLLLPGEEGGGARGTAKKRSLRDDRDGKRKRASSSTDDVNCNLPEVMREFMKQQMRWQKAWEDREAREEERAAREEGRAARRDELTTALLKKLQRDEGL